MKLILFFVAVALQAQVSVTISQQPSPFPLKGVNLYSADVCAAPTETRVRTISAGQIRQVAEGANISFQDPSLNSATITRASSRTVGGILMSTTKYLAGGIAVSAATISAFKAQTPGVGNTRTYAIIAGGAGAVTVGIPLAQSQLQSSAAAMATITNGVQAALIGDMTSLYAVPVGGCAKSVMFFGVGAIAAPVKGSIL